MTLDELLSQLKSHGFRDSIGHPLENCVDFHELARRAKSNETDGEVFIRETINWKKVDWRKHGIDLASDLGVSVGHVKNMRRARPIITPRLKRMDFRVRSCDLGVIWHVDAEIITHYRRTECKGSAVLVRHFSLEKLLELGGEYADLVKNEEVRANLYWEEILNAER